MRILFIAHRIPYPPNKGDKLRAFHIIKYLSKTHDVHLVSLYDDRNDGRHLPDLKSICKEVNIFYLNPLLAKIKGLISLIFNHPVSLGYFYSNKMKKRVNELLNAERFDLIFAYSSSMSQYVMDVKIKKIMDFVDCDSAKWRQYGEFAKFPLSWIYARECALLRKHEKKIAVYFDRLLVTTEMEKAEFAGFTDTDKFTVIGNGVDIDYFKPVSLGSEKKLVFTGQMDYFANVDGVSYFCREIFPLIKNKIPEAEFYIVGRNPTRLVKSLTKIKGVFVTGFVEDVRDYFKNASVFVAPLRIAEGIENKVLEAMASGLAVVSTSMPLRGLGAKPGRDLLIADNPKDFSEQASMLLEDSEMRKKIAENARRYVEENHSWEKNLSKINEILGEDARAGISEEHFDYISEYYKKKEVAQKYDSERFLSFSGRIFNILEKKRVVKLLRFLKEKKEIKTMLDIPCGTGRITEILAEERYGIYAADISTEMLDIARQRLVRFDNITYQIMDIKNMLYPDNHFDCITCIRLFHHLDRQDRVEILKELTRVTNRYIIINISYSSPWHILRRKIKKALGQGVSRISITDKEIIEDLSACGLEVVKRKFVLPLISEDLVLALNKR